MIQYNLNSDLKTFSLGVHGNKITFFKNNYVLNTILRLRLFNAHFSLITFSIPFPLKKGILS